MYTKTIKYRDLKDNELTGTFHFNLSKAEIVELDAECNGGLNSMIESFQKDPDPKAVYGFLKKLILKSYGEIADDEIHFVKNDKIRENFEFSDAYSELFMEIVSNADKAAEFMNSVIPKSLIQTQGV